MKQRKPQCIRHVLFSMVACLLVVVTQCDAKEFPFPSLNEAVDSAAAPANLRAVAARSTDPEVWLGLSFLAQPGDPVRPELSDRAVKAKPELGPAALVMANAMDGVDDASIAKLIKHDPDNALGYYLRGRSYTRGGEKESLEALRKGAACPEFRLYEGTISNALFKALDALDLKGRDRLCASSWMESRWSNFKISNLQTQGNVLGQVAKGADMETQKEISDLMLAVAGHLIGSDFEDRVSGERMLLKAFHLKADIAASQKSPAVSSYASVLQALASTALNSINLRKGNPQALADFLPDRIHRAFIVVDPNLAKDHLIELKNRPTADPEFDKAYKEWVQASKALIEEALPDQDEIIGAYFGGYMPPRTNVPFPWSSSGTYVERLVKTKTNLFAAAVVNERAMSRMNDLSQALLPGRQKASATMDPKTAAMNDCIYNLRLIDGAKQTWALEMGKQGTDTPSWSDIQPYLNRGTNAAIPTCPSGGTYTIGKISERPTCSVEGHVCP
jgi:hypothetical protein